MYKQLLSKAFPALLLLLVLFVSACSPQPEAGVVDVWATWASLPEETATLFDRFSQETGIQVRLQTGLKGSKIADRLAGESSPDLLLLTNADPVASLFDAGLIAALDDAALPAAANVDDLFPAALAPCHSSDGRLLCQPWGSDVQVLYWNKTLFQDAGLDPQRPPQSMEELLDYAAKLTRRDQAGQLIQVGFIPDLPGSHSQLFAGLLGSAASDDAVPAVDPMALQEALAWQQRFFDQVDPGQLEEFVSSFTPHRTSSHPVFAGGRLGCQNCHREVPLKVTKTPAAGFLNGQVAMMVDSGWLAQPVNESLARAQVYFGLAPFPAAAAAPQRNGASIVHGPVWVIPSAAVDRDAAGQLLAWLAAPDVQAEAALHNGLLPSGRMAAQDPRFHQSAAQETLLDLLAHPNAMPRLAGPQGPALNALLGDVEDVVFHTGESPVAMLSQLQQLSP